MDERDRERISQLGLVADKGLEWKAKCDALTAERDQLRAQVERLWAGLEECRAALESGKTSIRDVHYGNGITANYARAVGTEITGAINQAKSILAETPAQSIAAVRAAGAAEWLRGYIKDLLNMEPSSYKGAALAHLPQELDRLEREAKNG